MYRYDARRDTDRSIRPEALSVEWIANARSPHKHGRHVPPGGLRATRAPRLRPRTFAFLLWSVRRSQQALGEVLSILEERHTRVRGFQKIAYPA